jgi:SAM-dependent methyltransferase
MDIVTETLKTFALTHNYNLWVFEVLRPYIGKDILEIGCGIGNLTPYFKKVGRLTCIDKSLLFIQHMRIDYSDLEFHHFDITEGKVLSLTNKGFDTIICVNVLEHIEEDDLALSNMFKLLKPKGKLLLYVPALNLIYGTLDKNLGHFQRYDRPFLEKKLNQAGFHIEKIFFHNFLGAFGWFVNGKILKRKQLSILQTILFDRLLPIFARIERKIELPFGLSLVVICRRPMEKA